MRVFACVIGYLFISGMFAGLLENDMRNKCRILTGEDNRQILYLALLWPEFVGLSLVSTHKSSVSEGCDKTLTNEK